MGIGINPPPRITDERNIGILAGLEELKELSWKKIAFWDRKYLSFNLYELSEIGPALMARIVGSEVFIVHRVDSATLDQDRWNVVGQPGVHREFVCFCIAIAELVGAFGLRFADPKEQAIHELGLFLVRLEQVYTHYEACGRLKVARVTDWEEVVSWLGWDGYIEPRLS